MPPVQCCKCGFFTAHDAHGSGDYVEVDDEFREKGTIPNRHKHSSGGAGVWEFYVTVSKPLCFVNAHNLQEEAPDKSENSIIAVGHKQRECDHFIPYQRGLSPLEHREMKLVEKIQTETRAAQAASLYQAQQSRQAAWWSAVAAVISATLGLAALIVSIVALFAKK